MEGGGRGGPVHQQPAAWTPSGCVYGRRRRTGRGTAVVVVYAVPEEAGTAAGGGLRFNYCSKSL